MSQGLATIEAAGVAAPDEWSRERIDLIKRTYCKGATDDELALFVATCQRTGLSPEARQIFAVKRWDGTAGKEVMAIQTSIDGLRLTAERSGKWAGTDDPLWCGPDGVWRDVWLDKEHPAAAKVAVRRHDWQVPRSAVALWTEFAQTKKGGGLTHMWAQMPALMLAKCAEALALRSAFPAELSGLYTNDEMAQADAIPATAKVRPKALQTVKDAIADPTVQLLVDDLNAIADDDARKEAKAEFVKRFGKPEALKPEQYEEAAAYVASVTF